MRAIHGYKYQCLRCGALGNSIRCSTCGGDTEPVDQSLADRNCGRYTIFEHAQGVRTAREVSQEKLSGRKENRL